MIHENGIDYYPGYVEYPGEGVAPKPGRGCEIMRRKHVECFPGTAPSRAVKELEEGDHLPPTP